MARHARKWRLNFDEVTLGARTERSANQRGFLSKLVGVDARVQGGLRPWPGYRTVHRLGETDSVDYTIDTMYDFFPVTFQVGATESWNGFVARVHVTSPAPSYQILIEYQNGDGDWLYEVIESTSSASNAIVTAPMDVVVSGRLVYIFREGREPYLFYIDPDDDSAHVVTNTGPGYTLGSATGKPPEATITTHTIGSAESVPLEAGKYIFTYQLRDSVTGRVSGLAEFSELQDADFSMGSPHHVKMTIPAISAAEFNRWDQVRIYRSIRILGVGDTYSSRILLLEILTDLPTIPGSTLEYFFTLSDISLVQQDQYDNRAEFLNDMPFARAAALYQGTMVVANRNQEGDDATAVGEIRWSSPIEVSPELFPPDQRHPVGSTDTPIRFGELGDTLIGPSNNSQFIVLKFGASLAVLRMHDGFGIPNRYAMTIYESNGYLVTWQGFVQINTHGELIPLNGVDRILLKKEEWGADLEELLVVHDPRLGCIFILNPTQEKTLCFWLNTRAISEIHHTNFTMAGVGVVPGSATSVRRAMFVTSTGLICVVDDRREKTGPGGEARQTMLEVDGKVLLSLSAGAASSATALSMTGGTLGSNTAMRDAKITFVTGARSGESYDILNVSGSTINLESGLLGAAAAGDKVAISPIPVIVMGWHLGLVDEDGRSTTDLFRGRVAQSVGCHFENVTGVESDTELARFTARIYKGLNDEPEVSNQAKDGSLALTKPVVDGAPTDELYAQMGTYGVGGALLFPEVEITVADLDFVLLGMTVQGTIEDEDNYG